ncbi:MAG TPA: glycosyltransferase [Bacteroidales bacterium]|nr:glycosyltransferase [Bacteroidales bacterium]
MTKNLLILTDSFPYGASEQFLDTEIRFLEKSFERITILPLEKGIKGKKRDISGKITILAPPYKKISARFNLLCKGLFNLSPVLPFLAEGIRSDVFTSAARLRIWTAHFLVIRYLLSLEYLRDKQFLEGFGIIYFYWGLRWSQLIPFLPGDLRQKIVVRFHGSDLYEHTNNDYIPWRKQQIEGIGSAVVISEAGRKYFSGRYPFFTGKMVLSRMGTPDHGLNPVLKRDVFTIVSCSNLYPVKRVELIAKALSYVNLKIAWVHFGEGPTRAAVERQISLMPANIICRLAGSVPNSELMKYYSENPVDLFINLSSSEGVPVSIIEAMSFGIPVLATDVGGTGELVSGKTGKLIPPGMDPGAIGEIITLLLKREDSITLREASREVWSNKSKAEMVYPPFIEYLLSL